MSNTEKKTETPSQGQKSASPPAQSSSQQPPRTAPASSATTPLPKGPMISRRAFIAGAVLASAGLATVALAPTVGIFSPLVPPAKGNTAVSTVAELDQIQQAGSDVVVGPSGPMPFKFFYWPYDPSVSPYYRNVLVRVPPGSVSDETLSVDAGWAAPDPNGKGVYAAYNTTCVHLQCLVNPGFADNQYRLQCPCHGSQYEIMDGVPQAGPAFLLNLGRLPRIKLSLDSGGNIIAQDLEGTPGLGIK